MNNYQKNLRYADLALYKSWQYNTAQYENMKKQAKLKIEKTDTSQSLTKNVSRYVLFGPTKYIYVKIFSMFPW